MVVIKNLKYSFDLKGFEGALLPETGKVPWGLGEGVYLHKNRDIVKLSELELPVGVYAIYFDNVKCPFCRIFDAVWESLLRDEDLKGIKFVTVVCTYFHKKCSDETAKQMYMRFKVTRSPTVILYDNREGERVVELLPSRYKYDYMLIKNELQKFLAQAGR